MNPAAEKLVSVSTYEQPFEDLLEGIEDEALKESISKAQIVIVLRVGHAEYEGPVFPGGTREFYRFISQHPEVKRVGIEVASSESDYVELELHSEEWILPTLIILNDATARIAISAVGSYLADRLRGTLPGSRPRVSSDLVMTRNAIKLKYRGPADTYKEVVRKSLDVLARELGRDGS